MTLTASPLTRSFRDLPEKACDENEEFEFLHAGFGEDLTWDQLMKVDRVLIVSEAGMGKTHECQMQQRRLWEAGEPAFFLELMRLAAEPLDRQFDAEEAKRFASWKEAQTERAFFFLDSVDELKLTPHSFDSTLKIFAATLGDNLGRACIVITTRPGPDDRNVVRQRLPIPEKQRFIAPEELFADAAVRVEQPCLRAGSRPETTVMKAKWRFVGLTPLDAAQMHILAIHQGVANPDELLAAVEAEHAQEFAKRPLDLIDLCADWNLHGRIRGHREQVESSITDKLRPRKGRRERAPLSAQRAREGVERLALAALLTRRFTLWHGYEADRRQGDNALDPAEILKDWTEDEVQALLERALFGFASYGRVRFHNRTVIEFLTAERLRGLAERRLSDRTLRRLLFETSPVGVALIRPTMQPVAAWLAPWIDSVRAEILKREPSVLLRFADPGALFPELQALALERYVEVYGRGGWRGLSVPSLQCRRLASPTLAPTVRRLWALGIENPEVRETLLELTEAGQLGTCADIAHEAALSPNNDARERLLGLQVLAAVGDPRLPTLLNLVASQQAEWDEEVTKAVITHFYPAYLTVTQLLGALRGLHYDHNEVGGISRYLPEAIVKAELTRESLEELRHGLTTMVGADCKWEPEAFRVKTARRDLVGALTQVCELSLRDHVQNAPLAESIALALHLSKGDAYSDDDSPNLRNMLVSAPTPQRAAVFWAQHRLLAKILIDEDINPRDLLTCSPSLDLEIEKDLSWLQSALGDSDRRTEERECALECVIQLAQKTVDRAATLRAVRPLVEDEAGLAACLDELISAFENPRPDKWADDRAKREEDQARRKQDARASWVEFWRDLATLPKELLGDERAASIAFNLHHVMVRLPRQDEHYSGWNRGFLERIFDKATVERLRQIMISFWRVSDPPPKLSHERIPEERNTIYVKWRVGLAGIHAEAEDPLWARRLTDVDARLATRYAGTATAGLPSWLVALALERPGAVREVLLPELKNQLEDTGPQGQHSFLLQSLERSKPAVIALFMDTIREWVARACASGDVGSTPSNKFERAVEVLISNGNVADSKAVSEVAQRLVRANATHEQVAFWLPWLMRLSPADAVDELDALAASIDPAAQSSVTRWLSALFGHHAQNRSMPRALSDKPALLSRLALIAYRHVRLIDDLPSSSGRTSNSRDDAEFVRGQLVTALLQAKGVDAWHAKLDFAKDPLVAHFRDRAEAMARECVAEELDLPVYAVSDVERLESELELAPATRADMARLLVDRLEMLDDYLREDGSPRELWSGIRDERVLRRAIADRLVTVAHGAYSVSQEGVTAEEKETDIRLRSCSHAIEAVIELKVGDKPRYNYDVLSKALREQLVGKYMAPEARRVGCLLISINSPRRFAHPLHGGKIEVEEMIAMLQDEARELVRGLGFQSFLEVRLLDLRVKRAP